MPLRRTPNIFQLSTYLKSIIGIAKTIFGPINKGHPTNFEIQSDKRDMETSVILCLMCYSQASTAENCTVREMRMNTGITSERV